MVKPVLLSNVEHKALRVITERTAEYGDAVMSAATFPDEFRNVQSCYPIVFSKRSDTGQFQPVALFGFEAGQNLFLTEQGWDAAYVPLSVDRGPFMIGTQRPSEPGAPPQLVIHVDLDSPRLSTLEGEPLFREFGGTTDYLDRMSSVLAALHEGLSRCDAFVDAIVAADLLESFVLDVTLDDGSTNRFAGFYTINEERLRALDGVTIAELHARGWLEAVYMVVASTMHFRDLIDRRNRRLRGGN